LRPVSFPEEIGRFYFARFTGSGSLAMLAAIRRASLCDNSLAAVRRLTEQESSAHWY
jgi:hypothetical protein